MKDQEIQPFGDDNSRAASAPPRLQMLESDAEELLETSAKESDLREAISAAITASQVEANGAQAPDEKTHTVSLTVNIPEPSQVDLPFVSPENAVLDTPSFDTMSSFAVSPDTHPYSDTEFEHSHRVAQHHPYDPPAAEMNPLPLASPTSPESLPPGPLSDTEVVFKTNRGSSEWNRTFGSLDAKKEATSNGLVNSTIPNLKELGTYELEAAICELPWSENVRPERIHRLSSTLLFLESEKGIFGAQN